MEYYNINDFYTSITGELEESTKINIEETYEELQATAKKIIRNCELEEERLNKGIAVTEWVRGDELC